jgi:hypothetical protein
LISEFLTHIAGKWKPEVSLDLISVHHKSSWCCLVPTDYVGNALYFSVAYGVTLGASIFSMADLCNKRVENVT